MEEIIKLLSQMSEHLRQAASKCEEIASKISTISVQSDKKVSSENVGNNTIEISGLISAPVKSDSTESERIPAKNLEPVQTEEAKASIKVVS
ncbi:MAG: hypothetical protein ABIH42_06925, partial [Planctomycetota bacterium]